MHPGRSLQLQLQPIIFQRSANIHMYGKFYKSRYRDSESKKGSHPPPPVGLQATLTSGGGFDCKRISHPDPPLAGKHQPDAINLWKISLLSASASGCCPPEPFKDFPREAGECLTGEDRAGPAPSIANLAKRESSKRQFVCSPGDNLCPFPFNI